MRYTFAAMVAAATICSGTTPLPGTPECMIVDRVAALAGRTDPGAAGALEVLKRIGEGRAMDLSPDTESRLGLEPGRLHQAAFRIHEVRVCAIHRIGALADDEALNYLKNLKQSDMEPDQTGYVWTAVQIAVREAELNRLPNEASRVLFLEDVTKDRSAAAWWAVQELCNRGSVPSLGYIRESLARDYAGSPEYDRQMKFCEARISIIQRDPNRLKAIASVLTVAGGSTDQQVLGWAINQLHDMDSPAADAEINRYAREIDNLPAGSPMKAALAWERLQIRNLPPHSPK